MNLLTINQASAMLGVSRTTLYAYMKAGKLEYVLRAGKRRFVSEDAIKRLFEVRHDNK